MGDTILRTFLRGAVEDHSAWSAQVDALRAELAQENDLARRAVLRGRLSESLRLSSAHLDESIRLLEEAL